MFRCHFTRGGRIIQGENLEVVTLDDAIRDGFRRLAEKAAADGPDGFEIWQGALLLYSSAAGHPAPSHP